MNKMNLRLRPNDLLLKTLVCMLTTLIVTSAAIAAEDTDVVEDLRQPLSDIVELHYPVEVNAPYKLRRNTNGFMFGLTYENLQMNNYVSIADFTTTYADMFGDTEIPMYGVQLSYKYNFALGALTANAGLGYATYTSPDSGTMRTLSLTKYTLSASYIMDVLFNEPYAAPYITVGATQWGIDEKAADVEYKTGIELAYYYTVGVLVQLNWLDDVVSRKALMDYGLQNTYIDLFVTQYMSSNDPEDPDTSTDYTLGAGLRLEF
jgi:hypothetical protein